MFIYYRRDVETLLLIKGWSRWNKLLDSGLYKTTFMDLIRVLERGILPTYSSKFWSLAEMDILSLDLVLIRLSIKVICEKMDEPSAV